MLASPTLLPPMTVTTEGAHVDPIADVYEGTRRNPAVVAIHLVGLSWPVDNQHPLLNLWPENSNRSRAASAKAKASASRDPVPGHHRTTM